MQQFTTLSGLFIRPNYVLQGFEQGLWIFAVLSLLGQSGKNYFTLNLPAQKVPQFLRAVILVRPKGIVKIWQHFHHGMLSICEIHQMLNARLLADHVMAQLPKHLLLVIVCLNAPTELVETKRVEFHFPRAGITQHLAVLPGNAHVQRHWLNRAEKKSA